MLRPPYVAATIIQRKMQQHIITIRYKLKPKMHQSQNLNQSRGGPLSIKRANFIDNFFLHRRRRYRRRIGLFQDILFIITFSP